MLLKLENIGKIYDSKAYIVADASGENESISDNHCGVQRTSACELFN